jgi:protein arginine kinase activator
MTCQLCQKNPATIHVTDLQRTTSAETVVREQHVCEECARTLELPSAPVAQKNVLDIWKLLQRSAQKARTEGGLTCPACGMSLAEFRSKGRLGCPQDYEVFRAHLEPLLLRVHNSKAHRGRIPAAGDEARRRYEQLTTLRSQLEAAIRAEAYESAARLRDEIQVLEASRHGA